MLKTNEYFDGQVKSIGLNNLEGPATIGVMASGEYEFATSSKEFMTVISGCMLIKLPGSNEFKEYKENETFIVEANEKFQVSIKQETAYICKYK